ncbi:uncharacterized protein LOC127570483 [Pristis pectinata]|uniref:uncharacterized protein LOC127570483 n=1 Tax=Pristis pectinata TaxID=685728 RepID=UPI00223D3654|nr:uncharacterized protein LOC127570483 [Pristis pectinata]
MDYRDEEKLLYADYYNLLKFGRMGVPSSELSRSLNDSADLSLCSSCETPSSPSFDPDISYEDDYLENYLRDVSFGDDDVFLSNSLSVSPQYADNSANTTIQGAGSSICDRTISYEDDYLENYLKDVSYGDDDVFLPNSATCRSQDSVDDEDSMPLRRHSTRWDLANLSSSSSADTGSRPMTRYDGAWDLANISSSSINFQKATRSSCPLPRKKKRMAHRSRRSHSGYFANLPSSGTNTSGVDFDLTAGSNTTFGKLLEEV